MSRARLKHQAGAPRLLRKTFIGMCIVEIATVIAGVMVYKAPDHFFPAIFSDRAGLGLLLAILLILIGTYLLRQDYRPSENRRSFVFTAALNIFSMLLLIVVVELQLRLLVYAMPGISSIFPRGLLPKDWAQVKTEYHEILELADQENAHAGFFLIADPVLGWDVGAGRTGHEGLYASSVEGIRSADPKFSYYESPGVRRVALIGDSYTFGNSIKFEDTWGQNLQRRLGADFQVLNFGVDGYGVDQAYLKYLNKVRDWNPEIVIFGLISHDLYRSEVVYPFISFPTWRFPFSKPRFLLQNDRLVPGNQSLPSPESIFSTPRIDELPAIDLEPRYFPADWKWHWYDHLYIVRFVVSFSPNWPVAGRRDVNATIRLNTAIIREFVDSAMNNHSMPVAAFFPSFGAGEMDLHPDRSAASQPAQQVLSNAGIDYLDLTGCLQSLPRAKALASDGHYSPTANVLVADCLYRYLMHLNVVP